MSNKPSLAAAMKSHDTKANLQQTSEMPEKKPAATASSNPGRAGKKQVLGWFSEECKKQIQLFKIEQDKTEQAVLQEALNDFFTKYGKPTIA